MIKRGFKLEGKQAIAYYYLTEKYNPYVNELFYGGGAGGGKTYLGCYWHLERRLNFPGTRGLVGRHTLQDLKDTWVVSLYKLCQEKNLIPGYHFYYNQQSNKIHWYNGSTTILKELKYKPEDKNFDRLGSTEYTDAIIEEAPQIQERAFDVINSRLRWRLREFNLVPKILITGNASDSWCKQKFVCDQDGNIVELQRHKTGKYKGKLYQQVVLSTVDDNPDPEFREDYIQQLDRITNEYDRERLRYGNWLVKPRTGRLYFPDFDQNIHCTSLNYVPHLSLHHTVDFNKVPYMTSLQIQIELIDGIWWVYVIGETCTEYPLNRTRPMCKEIMKKYHSHNAGGFFYGDYTQRGRNSGLEEQYEHEFEIIEEELRPILSHNADRVIPNKPVSKRRDFVIEILKNSGKYPIKILIDHSCKYLKQDMNFLKQDKDGLKYKEYYQDRETKEKYQLYGHTSDALEYFLTSVFDDYFS